MKIKPKNVNKSLGDDIEADNILVLYRVGDPVGEEIELYYKDVRSIPDNNIIGLTASWGDINSSISADTMNEIFTQLGDAYIDLDIRATLLCGHFPKSISGVTANSLETIFCFFQRYKNREVSTRYNVKYSSIIGNFTFQSPFVNYRLPKMAAERFYGTLGPGLYMRASKNHVENFITVPIPVFRLDCTPVPVEDTRIVNASRIKYIKKWIDEGIAEEQKKYSNCGTCLL